MHASSTFGVVVDHTHTNIRRHGKIKIRKGEESSLRVELEALIHAYTLIPKHIHTIHAVDNETAIDIHNELASSGLPPQRALMQLPYHSTILRLHTAMQQRTAFLDIVHTLSHLEHVKTDDTDLSMRRQALARADNQADEGHHASYHIQDPSGIEDFALHVNGELVEKKASTPFKDIQCRKRMNQLYSRSLEGANHRAGPSPGWKTGGRQWPAFLRKFRHKLITQRLPTGQNRALRGDTEDGVAVTPWCPLCQEGGVLTPETHEHLLTCPCTTQYRFTLIRDINNIFKQYYTPRSLTPTMDDMEEGDTLDTIALPYAHTAAWTSYTTDKHGRKTPIARGTPGRIYGKTKRITSWAHNILRHCNLNIHPQNQKEYIDSIKPYNSLDPHLLQGIAQAIQATTIHDTIPHNPFIPTTTLPITTPSQGDLPTVINVSGNDVDWSAITAHLSDTRSWVIIADDTQLNEVETHCPGPKLTTIPPDTIALWNRSFWEGSSGLFPDTLDSATTIFTSPAVTELQRTAILDTIHMRSSSKGKVSAQSNIQTHTLTQETPSSILSLISESQTSSAKLQLLSGYITKDITDSWEGLFPTRLHQKIYRTLHKTITLHQHGVWLNRNNILHPQVAVHIPVDFGRKPGQKRTLPEEEETNPRDKKWKRQREAAFTRQRMWAGEPIPIAMKKRKRTSISAPVPNEGAVSTESDGSSTEEWPSPTTSDTETTITQPTNQEPPTRRRRLQHPDHSSTTTQHERDTPHQPTTSIGKRKRITEVTIRKPHRPHKQRQLTQSSKPGQNSPHEPKASKGKRKRITEVSIRKPQRPQKQRQLRKVNTPTGTYQRRTISELIEHIHATRTSIMTQLMAQREEGIGGRARVRLGLVGREGTINHDTDDGRPRTPIATPTLHNTHHEPQRAPLTPPPRPLDGRLGVGHRRIRHTTSTQHITDASHTQI